MKREQRYFVLKVKDIEQYLDAMQKDWLLAIQNQIADGRALDGKRPLQCVCVEDDWPEYEQVWAMIAARCDGDSLPAQSSLVVKLGIMRESNDRITYTVMLAKSEDAMPWDCHQVYSDSIKGRAEYEADSLKHFLGLGPMPDILAYDTDAPAQSEGEQK